MFFRRNKPPVVMYDDEGVPFTIPFGGVNIVHDPGYFEPVDYPARTPEEEQEYAKHLLEAVREAHARLSEENNL